MEQFLDRNPTLDVPISHFCWVDLIIGFKEPTWETISIQDQRQLHSRTQSKSPIASSPKLATEDQTPPLADVADVPHEQAGNADAPQRDSSPASFTHDPRPHRLENTLKPNVNLSRDTSITEAVNWLKGFTAWFDRNTPILDSKGPLTKRVLLENFLDKRLLSKLRTDVTGHTTMMTAPLFVDVTHSLRANNNTENPS